MRHYMSLDLQLPRLVAPRLMEISYEYGSMANMIATDEDRDVAEGYSKTFSDRPWRRIAEVLERAAAEVQAICEEEGCAHQVRVTK